MFGGGYWLSDLERSYLENGYFVAALGEFSYRLKLDKLTAAVILQSVGRGTLTMRS